MAISMQRAAKLCTAAELNLVKASAPRAIRGLTQKQVSSKLDRARRLRDKHRDLVQRQSLRTRARTGSKHGDIGPKNERTSQKLEIFEEVLERFETRLLDFDEADKPATEAETKAGRGGKRAAKRSGKRVAKKAAKKAAARVKKTGARAAAKTERKVSSGARGSAESAQQTNSKRKRMPADAKVLEQKIHAHVSSRVRRTQARRDRR